MFFGRKKKKEDEEPPPEPRKGGSRRMERAEEDYLRRLSDSIRQGNPYTQRPSPRVVQPDDPTTPLDWVPPQSARIPTPSPSPLGPPALSALIPPFAPDPSAPPEPPSARPRVEPDAPTEPFYQELQGLAPESLSKVLKPTRPIMPPTPPPQMPAPAWQAPAPGFSLPPAPPALSPPLSVPAAETKGSFEEGAILAYEDGAVWVYKTPKRGKEYEIVYTLHPNGTVTAEGIALYAYKVKVIGRLSPAALEKLEKTMRWERDAIVFHLSAYEYCSLIPSPAAPAAGEVSRPPTASGASAPSPPARTSPTPLPLRPATETPPSAAPPSAPATKEKERLVRGRRLQVSFGPGKSWEAVYWGRDVIGHVVAHHTHDTWALMHLDLDRFRDATEYGETLPQDQIARIQADLTSSADPV